MNLENHKMLMEWIRHNRFLRRKLARLSHSMFFVIYFSQHMKYKTADFQREIFKLTEDEKLRMCVVSAFRGSSKSTICGTSFPIWAMISEQAHFIVLASQTRTQARQQLKNIRDEFETNTLLRNDWGPFETEADEWGAFALNFKNYGTKIMAVSTEQAIRGLRHREHRPDLIILDDIENLDSTRSKESRDKISEWFSGEIIPLGTPKTRIFILGNFLHDYSLVGRIIAQMKTGTRDGVWKRFPILKDDGTPMWPGMYPNLKAIEDRRRDVGDEVAWKREYMLEIIPDDEQVIRPEWIQYYDELPEEGHPHTIFISADLAISEKETADCTAIVTGYVYNFGDGIVVYLMPQPINRRMSFPETVETIEKLYDQHHEICQNIKILIEDVGYQRAAAQELVNRGYPAQGIPVQGDKRSRLMTVSNFFKSGMIQFPRTESDILFTQLVGFPRERFDHLVDATTMMLLSLVYERPALQEVHWIDLDFGGSSNVTPLIRGRIGSGMQEAAERILYKNSNSGNDPTASSPSPRSSWGGGGSSSSGGSGIHIPPPSGGRSSGSGGDFMSHWANGDFLKK